MLALVLLPTKHSLVYEVHFLNNNSVNMQIEMQCDDGKITVIIGGRPYSVNVDGVIKSDFDKPELLLILPNLQTKNPIRIEGRHVSTEYTFDYTICGTRTCRFVGYLEALTAQFTNAARTTL